MNSRITVSLIAVVLMTTMSGFSQDSTKLILKFRSTCRTTTESGRLVTRVLTEREIIRDCAERAGLGTTNLNRFLLIYDVGSDFNGDTIKVVRREDGGVVCQPFRVLFQKSIAGADAARDERFGLMFNSVNTDTKGSVVITEKSGMITGRFQMFDDLYFAERGAICTGFFMTGRQVSWE